MLKGFMSYLFGQDNPPESNSDKMGALKRKPEQLEEPPRKRRKKEEQKYNILSAEDFFSLTQEIIEENYLPPYEGTKDNLKDGHIERVLDGGMHAARLGAFIYVLHHMMKQYFPETVGANIATLEKEWNLNEDEILRLVIFSGLHHKNIGNAYPFFIKHRLPKTLSEMLTTAAEYANTPQAFEEFVKSKRRTIPTESIEAWDYIRRLIYLADHYDTIRCFEKFDFERAQVALMIKGYDPQIHDPIFIELSQHILALIKHQKDWSFPTRFSSPDDDNQSSFSLAHKVKYEHADNVMALILQDMLKDPYFAQYLPNVHPPLTTYSQVTPAFNPFIHGSNALSLVGLSKTGYKLYPPMEMLETYHAAAEGGEISGGLSLITTEDCQTCFGRLGTKPQEGLNYDPYSFDKIKSGYTQRTGAMSNEALINKLKEEVDLSTFYESKNIQYINIILIYLGRAKQRGIDVVTEVFSGQTEAAKFVTNLRAHIQALRLIYFLGKYIHPNFSKLNQLDGDARQDIQDAILKHIKFQAIIPKLVKGKIDVKAIFENPTKAGLNKILRLFELPNLKLTQPFTLEAVAYPKGEDTGFGYFRNYYMDKNTIHYWLPRGAGLAECVREFIRNPAPQELALLYPKLDQTISALEKKVNLFETLLYKETDEMTYTSEQDYFLTDAFPLMYVCDDEEKIDLHDYSTQEYRAKGPLKPGEDIKMMATDTPTHFIKLAGFLEKTPLGQKVELVLFDDLEASIETHKPPMPPKNLHRGGFPTLQWLCAKAVVKDETVDLTSVEDEALLDLIDLAKSDQPKRHWY